ncbi:hypothetical protein CEXT_354441, partial [Caerostris extrusa]
FTEKLEQQYDLFGRQVAILATICFAGVLSLAGQKKMDLRMRLADDDGCRVEAGPKGVDQTNIESPFHSPFRDLHMPKLY